ncbi:MAG: hypothetical protein QOF78_856 [Phycisphaerales bacterium]|jgi:hypothetical protein|nr:hypothetical protein [Phycisphaerales bacterium]
MKNLLAGTLVILASLCLPLAGFAAPAPAPWEKVAPVDWSKIKLADFTDDQLDLPYYLHHFHTVANAVEENGPTRGFMTLPVWRGRDKNQQGPHNARVMESYLTLAFFYCTDRPWNPYFGDRNVRDRLEAMLTFWCNMQNPDGRFSEYKPQGWNLPATAFATKFMGQTLTLLKRAGDRAPIDAALHKRVIDADRKAILVVLTNEDLYKHGTRFTNQYTNVFAGAAAYLDLFPDEKEIPPLLEKKFFQADKDFRSPCGYFYEADGPDFGYTLHTHHSNARMTYHYFGHDTPIGATLEKQDAAWNDWLGYNLLREPDGSTFVFNRGVQTRQNQPNWDRQDGPFGERVENARAFATTREERDAWVKTQRAELSKNWGKFPDLVFSAGARGSPVSPYSFLHRDHKTFYPTNAQRDAAVAKLPYLASDNFIKQLKDTRKNAVFTFVRRRTYYAAFNSGEHITDQQRLGLGVIWSPKAGTILQSQTGSDDHAWGTRADGAEKVYEAGDVAARFNDDFTQANYPLGSGGKKSVVFAEGRIEVLVEHPGNFTEQIPLLATDAIEVYTSSSKVSWLTKDGPKVFGERAVHTVVISATDSLKYRLHIKP